MYQSRWAPKPDQAQEKVGPGSRATTSKEVDSLEQPIDVRSPSSLSASAPTFAPSSPSATAPDADVPTADSFATTGAAQEDLFDDVVPVDDSMRVRSEDNLFNDDFTPIPQPIVEQPPQVSPHRGRGDGQRARGRGRGGRGRGNLADRTDLSGVTTPKEQQQQRQQQPTNESLPSQRLPPPSNAPTGPRNPGPTPAVRGDRQLTGGIRKPKLTEEELATKMAQISIRNAELSAAHARAEADAASFAEREAQAKQRATQRQKEERRDRQQMMGERERNRQRKLKATEGREWDAEKKEEDFARGGRFDKRGGFAGDAKDYGDGREYLYREPRGGKSGGSEKGGAAKVQALPKQEEFPALPAVAAKDGGKVEGLTSAGANAAAPEDGPPSSWADQMSGAT